MNFNKNMRSVTFASAMLVAAASAFATQDSIAQKQEATLNQLDSMESSVLGLRLNGSAKAGALVSNAKSDQFDKKSPTRETQAYTDVNLAFKARPSSESEIHVEVRLHKDWQSGFDENNNPIHGHWFSYDGLAFDRHLGFNFGYMRVGFTPLTLFVPQPELLQEPEIFAANRVDALAQRNLDTTNARLMHGVNADYHSGQVGAVDDIHAQLTGSRMRANAKKGDQVFFDFDWTDRYFYGGRLGVDAYGAHVGANYVDVFDRKKSRRSAPADKNDTIYYDDNMVYSAELGFNSSKLLSSLPVVFGFNAEYAASNWKVDYDYTREFNDYEYNLAESIACVEGVCEPYFYVKYNSVVGTEIANEDLIDLKGKASLNVKPYVMGSFADIDFDLKGTYLQTDENFWSEMASSSYYRGNAVVLNANALYGSSADSRLVADFGMSSLENLYMSVYNSNPLNANNLLTSYSKNILSSKDESNYLYSRLDNNYKNAHFYRNGYSASAVKRMELSESLYALDPAMNMAMPYGDATPDRKGFNVSLDLKWLDAVSFNARFAKIKQAAVENNYTQYAVGLGVDVGEFFPSLDRKLLIQGSYDHSEEDAYMLRKSNRVIAGATLDIWGPITLLAGYQTSERTFDNPLLVNSYTTISSAKESMILAGPQIKIAPNSFLNVQYGLLKDEVGYNWFETDEEGNAVSANRVLSIDKNFIVANVLVNF